MGKDLPTEGFLRGAVLSRATFSGTVEEEQGFVSTHFGKHFMPHGILLMRQEQLWPEHKLFFSSSGDSTPAPEFDRLPQNRPDPPCRTKNC